MPNRAVRQKGGVATLQWRLHRRPTSFLQVYGEVLLVNWNINRRKRRRQSREAIQEAVDLKDRAQQQLLQTQRKQAVEERTVLQPLRRTRERLTDENHIADMIWESLRQHRKEA